MDTENDIKQLQNEEALFIMFKRYRRARIKCLREIRLTKGANEDLFNKWGYSLLQQGRLKTPLAIFAKAAQINPNSALAHYNIGFILNGFEKYEEAIEEYAKAMELDPKWPTRDKIYCEWGTALYNQKKYKEAFVMYQKAIEVSEKASYYINAGIVAYYLK